jgi:hypothetical protein
MEPLLDSISSEPPLEIVALPSLDELTPIDNQELREYIVTLKEHQDLDSFYEDMETPGGNLYIPDRAIEVAVRRPISRNTNYLLTYEEAEQLRNDPRVRCIEGVNARSLVASDLIAESPYPEWHNSGISLNLAPEDGAGFQSPQDPAFDLAVIDVSFISQTLMLPAIVALLKPGAVVLSLVKPQFELQPGQVGKGGIVRDAASYLFVEQRLRDACADAGLTVLAWFDSPIAGGDGNREFFIYASKSV